jgi:hypothetical protein
VRLFDLKSPLSEFAAALQRLQIGGRTLASFGTSVRNRAAIAGRRVQAGRHKQRRTLLDGADRARRLAQVKRSQRDQQTSAWALSRLSTRLKGKGFPLRRRLRHTTGRLVEGSRNVAHADDACQREIVDDGQVADMIRIHQMPHMLQ